MPGHQLTDEIKNRLKRSNGHLDSVIRMLESERDCLEVVQQLQAVISALQSAKKVYIQDHIEGCLESAIGTDDVVALNERIRSFKEVAKYL